MNKVSPTLRGTEGASHNPALYYDEQDEHGKIRTFFMTHPAGNRKVRRYRQRHHPSFTKSTHKGRDWWQLREAWRTAAAPKVESGEESTDDSR